MAATRNSQGLGLTGKKCRLVVCPFKGSLLGYERKNRRKRREVVAYIIRGDEANVDSRQ